MNDDRRAAILAAIEEGCWPSVAARTQGYSKRQWDALLEDGAFALVVEAAEARAELALIRAVRTLDKGVGGVGFLLERRFPARWSGQLRARLEEERQELLASLKAGLDEVTFRRVVGIADAAEVAKRKKSA